jgi:hypothetical protein
MRPSTPEAPAALLPPPPLRLLPGGAIQFPGGSFTPLWTSAFSRRTATACLIVVEVDGRAEAVGGYRRCIARLIEKLASRLSVLGEELLDRSVSPIAGLALRGSQNIVRQDFLSLLVHAAGTIVCARNHRDEVKPRNSNDLIAAISGHEECRIALLARLE